MSDKKIRRTSWCGACLWVAVILLGMLSGCDQSASPTNGSSPTPIEETTATDADPLSSQPVEAVTTLLKAFQDGEAGVIWDLLPPRHHVELNKLMREFAAKMDREVWKRLFVVARRIVEILRDKRELIVGNPELKFPSVSKLKLPSVNKRLLSENYSGLLALLLLIVDSELSDLDKLRNFDGKTFFSGTGTRFLKQLVTLSANDPNDPFRKGFDAKVRLVHIDGTKATIGLMMDGTFVMTRQAVDEKQNETQMEMQQIDGVWFVTEFDYGLRLMYKDGREMVAGIPDDAIRKNRTALLKLLQTVEEDLDRIELAKTSNEFVQSLALAQVRLNQLLSAGIDQESGTGSEAEPVPRGRTVTVVVKGEMDKATRQRVLDRLKNLKRQGERSRVTGGQGLMTVIIPTDRFLQDVIDAIDFGVVGDVDEVERQVIVILKPEPKPKPATRVKQDDSGT